MWRLWSITVLSDRFALWTEQTGGEMAGLVATRIFLGALLVGSFSAGEVLAQERIGTITNVKVYAYGTPAGQRSREPAFAQDVAKTHTEYQTVKGASLEIVLDDGGTLELSGESEIILERSGAGPVVLIRTGTVKGTGSANIRFIAGTSTALFRGGQLSVQTDPTGASVFSLFRGETDLGIGGSNPISIEPGTAVAVSSNGQIDLGHAGTRPNRATKVTRSVGEPEPDTGVPSTEGFSFESGGISFSGSVSDGETASGSWSGGGSSGGFGIGSDGSITVSDGQTGESISVPGVDAGGGGEDPGM
jgi:hypothetical protein